MARDVRQMHHKATLILRRGLRRSQNIELTGWMDGLRVHFAEDQRRGLANGGGLRLMKRALARMQHRDVVDAWDVYRRRCDESRRRERRGRLMARVVMKLRHADLVAAWDALLEHHKTGGRKTRAIKLMRRALSRALHTRLADAMKQLKSHCDPHKVEGGTRGMGMRMFRRALSRIQHATMGSVWARLRGGWKLMPHAERAAWLLSMPVESRPAFMRDMPAEEASGTLEAMQGHVDRAATVAAMTPKDAAAALKSLPINSRARTVAAMGELGEEDDDELLVKALMFEGKPRSRALAHFPYTAIYNDIYNPTRTTY